jgi:hypothetical protein
MSEEFIIQLTVSVVSVVVTGFFSVSTTLYRIKQLEKIVEKHNCLVERMVAVEQSTKSAHHRIDGLERVK